MTRLAGITTVYALIAALVLVAPLSAADEVPPPTPAPAAPPEAESAPPEAEPAPSGTASPDGAPAAPDAPPAEQAPAPPAAAAPAPPPADAPASPPAEAVAAPSEEPSPDRKRSSRAAPRAIAAADTSVTIRDFEFAPSSVTVDVGDTVTWSNEGPTPHSATADDGSFDTGIFEDGQSRSHTFEQAGTFQYFCTPHPQMRGTVTVRAAAGQDGGGGGGSTSGDTGDTAADDTTAGDDGAAGDSSGGALPATGIDAGGVAVLGLMTLALGAWLRRRASSAG